MNFENILSIGAAVLILTVMAAGLLGGSVAAYKVHKSARLKNIECIDMLQNRQINDYVRACKRTDRIEISNPENIPIVVNPNS